MEFSTSLKQNFEFRRLYSRGKSAGAGRMMVFCRKNRSKTNRVGITVSTKLGKAVQRNRIRRRFREIYRLNESRFKPGYDIVIVARFKSKEAPFDLLESEFLRLADKLGLIGEGK